MRFIAFFLCLATVTSVAQSQTELKALPFTGRKVDVSFARELYETDLKGGVAKLREKGIKVLGWNPRTKTIAAWGGGPEQLSASERAVLIDYAAKSPQEFQALSIPKGAGVIPKSESSIVVLSEMAGHHAKNVLAHEWLHLKLLELEDGATLDGHTLPPWMKINSQFETYAKEVRTKYAQLKFRNLTPELVTENAIGYEVHVLTAYLNGMLGLVTLVDELDVHMVLKEMRLTDAGTIELQSMALHLADRIAHSERLNLPYRALQEQREHLTKPTIEFGDGSLKLERAFKGLANTLMYKLKTTCTAREYAEWSQTEEARNLFRAASK